jgi:hypothetical protein
LRLEGTYNSAVSTSEDYTNDAIANINNIHFAGPYATTGDIPQPFSTNTIYLVGTASPYTQYITIDGTTLIEIGSTDIDLSDYYKKEETNSTSEIDTKDASTLQQAKDYTDSKVPVSLTSVDTLVAVVDRSLLDGTHT